MLGQVSSNHQYQPVKPVKVRDLSMRTYYITVNTAKKAKSLQEGYRPPKSRFATTWLRGNGRRLRVDVAVVSPKPKEPQGDFPLGCRELEDICQAISHLVELSEEKLW